MYERTAANASGFERDIDFANAQRSGSPGMPVCRIGVVQSLKGIIQPKNIINALPNTGIEHISIGNMLACAVMGRGASGHG